MYGWGNFTVLKTAGIAALAYVFAQSVHSVWALPNLDHWIDNFSVKMLASALLVVLTFVNIRGVVWAEKLSTSLTYFTLVLIGCLIICCFVAPQGQAQHLAVAAQAAPSYSAGGWAKAIILSSLGAFWGYEGWNHIGFMGEEIKNPTRNLPLALGVGTSLCVGLYVLLNGGFFYVVPIDFFVQMQTNPNQVAAVEVARYLWGSAGALGVALLIVLTTLASTNTSVMTCARIFYAMARDGLFFTQAQRVHPTYQTPHVALWMQAFWSVALIWSGSFDQLTDMLIFAAFIFYGSTAWGVVVLRRRQPEAPRSYRVAGYPWVPLIFCLFCISLFFITLYEKPAEALAGLGLIATGLPFYWFWNKKPKS
jgi:basic amino acid/polyamine antiporter, APA family